MQKICNKTIIEFFVAVLLAIKKESFCGFIFIFFLGFLSHIYIYVVVDFGFFYGWIFLVGWLNRLHYLISISFYLIIYFFTILALVFLHYFFIYLFSHVFR